tara:strand:- start:1130 stop:1696 length:567 start_codon:yes stop_codon:yes gene_type:complete
MVCEILPPFFAGINTISVPLDAVILLISLLLFGLLIFSFSNYVETESQNILTTNNLQISPSPLDVQVDFQEKPSPDTTTLISKLGKLDLFSNSKFLGLGALAFLALGGTSLLLLDKNQSLPQALNTAHSEYFKKSRPGKSPLSFRQKHRSEHLTSHVEKISYLSPSLATMQTSDCKNVYKNEPVRFSF